MRGAPSTARARLRLAAGLVIATGWPLAEAAGTHAGTPTRTQAGTPANPRADAPAAALAGDTARGAVAYEARCGGCHSVAADRVGPRHAGVFGRRAGSVPGFDDSPALRQSPVVWNATTLALWLADPEVLIRGQRMGYSLADPALRADVIAYLTTLGP